MLCLTASLLCQASTGRLPTGLTACRGPVGLLSTRTDLCRGQVQRASRSRLHQRVTATTGPKVAEGPNGLQKVLLRNSTGGSAEVFLHGASVTSWKSDQGQELFFLTEKAIYAPPKPIRGGIPLCFPQFGPMGSIQNHGFARNSVFELHGGSDDTVVLSLTPTTDLHKTFPYDFQLLVTVKLESNSLTQTLEVENRSSEPMPLGVAFHTYFAVSDVDSVTVDLGSEGLTYLDGTQGKAEKKLKGSTVKLQEEWDAIFVGTKDTLKLIDEKAGRTMTIKKDKNLPDAVVWNPWEEKANGFADMAEGEWRTFVCLEPALAASGPIDVQPSQTWTCTQVLSVTS